MTPSGHDYHLLLQLVDVLSHIISHSGRSIHSRGCGNVEVQRARACACACARAHRKCHGLFWPWCVHETQNPLREKRSVSVCIAWPDGLDSLQADMADLSISLYLLRIKK